MKLLTLDTLGCGIFGSHLPATDVVFNTLLAMNGYGACGVWGRRGGLSAANAAMVNATAVHGFEVDDVGLGGHFGAVTIPVALALAEDGHSLSGEEFLRSLVVGIEIGSRIAAFSADVPQVKCGFHGPSLAGAFAAAATSAFVLRLDEERCLYAVATAAQFACGLMATQSGGMGKRVLLGKAVHSGMFAAYLASHNFVNVEDVLAGGYGSFVGAFSGGRSTRDLGKLMDGLGETYRSYGVGFKMWACREPIHPALEALRVLQKECYFRAADVDRVDVRLPEGSFRAVGFAYRGGSVAEAQLSLQYCVAAMLLFDEVFVEQFAEGCLRRPDVLDIASRVSVTHDRELDSDREALNGAGVARNAVVEVTLLDGRRRTRLGRLRGADGDPVESEEVVKKFRKLVGTRLTSVEQEGLIGICGAIEGVGDIRELARVLRATRVATEGGAPTEFVVGFRDGCRFGESGVGGRER